MKKIISLLLISLFLSSNEGFLCYAEDAGSPTPTENTGGAPSILPMPKRRSTEILEDFKSREHEFLFESIPFTSEQESSILDADGHIRSLENILERLDNIKQQVKINKRLVTQKKITLKNAIKDIEDSITKSEESITAINGTISENNRKIVDVMAETEDINQKIESNKQTLLKYITYISKKSDLMYSNTHEIDIMKSIILNDGNISDIYNDIYFKSLLEVAGYRLIEEHRSLLKELYYNKEKIKTEKREKMRLKNQILIEQKTLEDQKATKERLLEFTRGKEGLFNQYLIDREDQENKTKARLAEASDLYEKNLENLAIKNRCQSSDVRNLITKDESGSINDLLDPQASSSVICANLGAFIQAEKNLRLLPDDKNTGSGIFDWPIAATRISTYFHDPDYFEALGSDHDAIDIPAPQGSDIVAPRDGYVYYVNPPKPGNYSYLAIKHPDGFVTVYGHLSDILVSNFEIVKKGQVIAKSGGEVGTPGAGPMTIGPHLHFEMYTHREAVDPLFYLDVTSLSFESLPKKYTYKYIDDFKNKYGERANISKFQTTFLIRGTSEIERQKYFLSQYASTDFSDWNIWIEESIAGNIDPTLPMCIGLAETGLGRSLKSGFNVGNVGNTDSGGVYEFSSARDGVYWIIKTLNNQYLSKYDSINELSRWDNKSGPIYASSPKYWHDNLVRCISALKGTYVGDNFVFRIKKHEEENTVMATMVDSGSLIESSSTGSTLTDSGSIQ